MTRTEVIARDALFKGSCVALVAVAFNFAGIAGAMLQLKDGFALTNTQVGWIGGAGLWGLALSQLLFSPFCDVIGLRPLLRLAFVGHLAGVRIDVLA